MCRVFQLFNFERPSEPPPLSSFDKYLCLKTYICSIISVKDNQIVSKMLGVQRKAYVREIFFDHKYPYSYFDNHETHMSSTKVLKVQRKADVCEKFLTQVPILVL